MFCTMLVYSSSTLSNVAPIVVQLHYEEQTKKKGQEQGRVLSGHGFVLHMFLYNSSTPSNVACIVVQLHCEDPLTAIGASDCLCSFFRSSLAPTCTTKLAFGANKHFCSHACNSKYVIV